MLRRRNLLAGLAAGAFSCGRAATGAPPEGTASPAPPGSATVPGPGPAASSAVTARPVVPPAPDLPASSAPALPSPRVDTRRIDFEPTSDGPEAAVLVVPGWGAPGERFPVLVALHGQGEARKGLEAGAWGWVRDYGLDRAMARLREPPLTAEDFQGFFDPKRLERINASLAARPFRGLVVACPYTPDLLVVKSLNNAKVFGAFVTQQLLPRVVAEAPALAEPAATGIDGVSLGGRVALLVGLARAERFGAVGSMQAAVQLAEAPELSRRAARAMEMTPGLRLRLLSSDHDFYRGEIWALHGELTWAKVAHEHLVVPGPHDYPFNRGPGAIEMLLWHDRVLRGEPGL